MIIIDNFLDDYSALRALCDVLDYTGTENPFDGVVYPGINTDIPESVKAEVEAKAENLFDTKLKGLHFIRRTLEGVEIPQEAHDDALMCDLLLLIYLNRQEHCQGGTELVRHIESGMESAPQTVHMLEHWQRDHSVHEAWEILKTAEMKQNRAVLLPAHLMHRASMPNAFGTTNHDGRLVYSCFLSFDHD